MARYLTKRQLYSQIHQYKQGLGLDHNDYRFNMLHICKQKGILLEQIPFSTKHLRGMAAIGSVPGEDVILLNSNRSNIEQNFDCGHEYVHLCLHRRLEKRVFNCLDAVCVKQDEYIEWQANEGAAEMLVPYRVLLPLIKTGPFSMANPYDIAYLKDYAADMFNVTRTVIEYRLESLKYEIHQYINGIPLRDIKMLSLSQQKRQKINIKSLNDIEKELRDLRTYSLPRSNFINFDSAFI